jgi:mono/diheme cytochrome c family protein
MFVEVSMVARFIPTRLKLTTTLALAAFVAASAPARAQDAAKKGQEVYTAQKCQTCHAIAGKGGKVSALDGVGGKLSADDIKEWITHPKEAAAKAKSTKKPPMPAKYGSLPAADLDALVAYMASLK